MRAHRPELRVMSAGRVIEIYKEVGLPARLRRAVRARRLRGHARPRPHAHGDREPRHDRGLAPVLDRPRPLPRPQRLALEPQRLRRKLRREGIAFQTENDTEVAAGYLDLAAARGRVARRRRSKAASTTSTASTPSSSARPTASRSCAIRSPASRPCWPRPTTGSRWRPSTARSRCCPARTTRASGSPSRGRLRVGEGAASRDGARRPWRPRSSISRRPRCAS